MKYILSFQCDTHEEAQAVLAAVAAIGKEPMFSMVVADGGETRPCIELEVWVDGAPTAHRVTLNANGTWRMTTEVAI